MQTMRRFLEQFSVGSIGEVGVDRGSTACDCQPWTGFHQSHPLSEHGESFPGILSFCRRDLPWLHIPSEGLRIGFAQDAGKTQKVMVSAPWLQPGWSCSVWAWHQREGHRVWLPFGDVMSSRQASQNFSTVGQLPSVSWILERVYIMRVILHTYGSLGLW